MSLPPLIQDFNKAIESMKSGKAPGSDNILLKFSTRGGPELNNHLMHLILKIRETNTFSSNFHDTNTITMYKKGDQENCSNYHSISLLSTGARSSLTFCSVTSLSLQKTFSESQCGFKPYQGTINIIFFTFQLQKSGTTASHVHLLGPQKDLQ